jgi:hypothetical protein
MPASAGCRLDADGARDPSPLYEGVREGASRRERRESTREQALNHRETPKLAPMNLDYNRKALLQAPGQARALDEKNCLHLKAVV